jgi:hypothetical protein
MKLEFAICARIYLYPGGPLRIPAQLMRAEAQGSFMRVSLSTRSGLKGACRNSKQGVGGLEGMNDARTRCGHVSVMHSPVKLSSV